MIAARADAAKKIARRKSTLKAEIDALEAAKQALAEQKAADEERLFKPAKKVKKFLAGRVFGTAMLICTVMTCILVGLETYEGIRGNRIFKVRGETFAAALLLFHLLIMANHTVTSTLLFIFEFLAILGNGPCCGVHVCT